MYISQLIAWSKDLKWSGVLDGKRVEIEDVFTCGLPLSFSASFGCFDAVPVHGEAEPLLLRELHDFRMGSNYEFYWDGRRCNTPAFDLAMDWRCLRVIFHFYGTTQFCGCGGHTLHQLEIVGRLPLGLALRLALARVFGRYPMPKAA